MNKEELIFCPLGGSGEIGMNMNLYAYGKEDDQKWIIVDMGVTFADDTIPGVDLIMPDPGFIIDKKDDLLGIVLTHAHEDHIGAVAHIWPELKCKLYATPFTAALIYEKFKETDFKVINTGIKHGTITLVSGLLKLELTTLRKDVKTDGRHAEVEYINDWQLDSERRDFTINAIYCELNTKSNEGFQLFDPHNGKEDLINDLYNQIIFFKKNL